MSWKEASWWSQWAVVAVLLVLLVVQTVALAVRSARLSADVQRGTQPPTPEDQ